MAREMTPQERAAELAEQISGAHHQLAYPGATIRSLVYDALQQTRRAALLEAAQVVREFAKHYPTDIFIEPLPGQHGRTEDACSASAIRAICPTVANDIDRLAQEG